MPPTNETLKFWKTGLRKKLLVAFSKYQKNYLKGKGEIVEGDETQYMCNQVFGLQVNENVVSEYGIALTLKHDKIPVPAVVIGVSIKDFPHPKPLSYYGMMYSLRDEVWHYGVINYKGDDSDYHHLEMTLEAEFKKWSDIIFIDNVPLE